jgi:hypothetical protein
MKVECYRKRLINRIKYFFLSIFKKEYMLEHGKKEMIKRWHANPMTFSQDCYGTTLPPFASFRLNVASKIMEIGDWRSKYGR